MELFPLALFPTGSLANSVVTTVWIGVLVVSFFNLRLGWVLSGLVVPGYLAPLLIAKPWAAVAVSIEGIVTYLLVWFYSERLMRWGGLAGFFGRDRFFAMVLISILVRILFDGWLFPLLGEWANETFRLQFDYRNNLHSFGLIIVCLIANQFWKTGLIRGIPTFIITVGLTWLITRYGLMELTNFSISNLSYMYEDVAASMLASPKSYIILITAAFIASRMNLLYGWDFNGILIPSLLALLWYQPDKILISFIEALVVLGLAILILRLPRYQSISMEGARKLMLFFNISFAWKLLLGFLLLEFFPQVKVSDYFGFGYMLTSLIAIKMHDKEIAVRLTRATLQTSLVAVAGATVIGFALTFLLAPMSWSVVQPVANATPPVATKADSLIEVMREKKLQLYQNRRKHAFTIPLPAEADQFIEGVRLLRRHIKSGNPEQLALAQKTLQPLNFHVRPLQERYLLLEEGLPRRGWGTYVLNLQPTSSIVLEVPAPLEEWGTVEAATWLLEKSGGRALAMAGSARMALADGSADVLRNRQTPFHLFHREMAGNEAVQIRALAGEALRVLSGIRDADAPTRSDGQVWLRGVLPAGLDLRTLELVAPSLQFNWAAPPLINVQREESRGSFAEIFLHQPVIQRMLLQAMQAELPPRLQVADQRIDGYLQEWLFSSKERIAPRGSNHYQPPRLGDLLYWDSEILSPMINAAQQQYLEGDWTTQGLQTLQAINAAAARFGYELSRYHQRDSGSEFLLLREVETTAPRYWGTYVLRLATANEFIIQAPRPLYEGTSFEFAVHLFESLDARWLLIGGTHPSANSDGSADLIRARSPRHLFNLVNQVILRQANTTPMLAVQSRVFAAKPDQIVADADLLLAFNSGQRERALLPPLGKTLLERIEAEQFKVRFVDGTGGTSGYEVGLMPQVRYLEATKNKDYAVLWLAPAAKRGLRQQLDNPQQDARFAAIGLTTQRADLIQTVEKMAIGDIATLPAAIRQAVLALQEFGDMIPLSQLLEEQSAFRFWRLQDVNTAQSFLLVNDANDRLLLAANLDPRSPELHIPMPPGSAKSAALRQFIDTRAGLLEGQGGNQP